MPVFVQMLIAMRAQLWDQSGVDKIGLDMKAVDIGAAISYDSGLRPGHVTQADGPDAEDHCLRAGDFAFISDPGECAAASPGVVKRSEPSW